MELSPPWEKPSLWGNFHEATGPFYSLPIGFSFSKLPRMGRLETSWREDQDEMGQRGHTRQRLARIPATADGTQAVAEP